jgi:hypothetical protein
VGVLGGLGEIQGFEHFSFNKFLVLLHSELSFMFSGIEVGVALKDGAFVAEETSFDHS